MWSTVIRCKVSHHPSMWCIVMWCKVSHHPSMWCIVIKGSWEAILPRYGQIEFWVLKWWRVVRDWHLTLKGGVRLRLDLEGWCAIEKGWCVIDTWPWRVVWRVVCDWDLTWKGGARLRLDLEGWCAIETWSWRVVCDWDLTLKGGARLRVDLEGWCETSHDLDEGWLQIGLRLDLEGCCAIETWSWRVVCDWDLTLKGGARLRVDLEGWCETSHDLDEGWLQIGLRLDLEGCCAIETWPWRVVCDWDLTLKGGARLRVDLEGWCETSHDLDEGWLQIGLRLYLEGCCAIETWPWRVVCDWDLTLMKGGCRSHCNGCMNVAWAMFWGGSRSTKPCVFPCKVAAGDDERYLVCATGAAAVVPDAIGSFYVFCNKWLFLWCSSMRFLKLWLQIAL